MTFLGDELAEECNQGCHGLVYRTAKDTGVKVGAWPSDVDVEVCQPTKTVGKGWCAVVEPIVVGL